MKTAKLILFMAVAAAAFAFCCSSRAEEKNIYLFSYFEDHGDGLGDGLHLAWSNDGLDWKPLNDDKVFFKPKQGEAFRDPNILLGPDGVFRMVWTTSWNAGGIGYAESKDLINWTNEKMVPVMASEPKARNTWAPEIFYQDDRQQYMIFWSSTIPGRFPETEKAGDDGYNHRFYYTTTNDFEKFATTKLLYDPGFNCIDATIVKSGKGYTMFFKNETLKPVKKYIVSATSDYSDGPYGNVSAPITLSWTEGPSILRDGTRWLLYYDNYSLHTYGVSTSRDLKHWSMIGGALKMPRGVRHGTAFAVPQSIFDKLPK